MSRTIHVAVSQDDIDFGVRHDARSCPIALSLSSLDEGVYVTRDWVIVMGGEFDLPPEAASFVSAFDEGEAVEPFEFDLIEVHS